MASRVEAPPVAVVEAAEADHGERILLETVAGLYTWGRAHARMTAASRRQEFPPTPASAGEARRFVESAMADADLVVRARRAVGPCLRHPGRGCAVTEVGAGQGLVTVRILGLPVEVYRRASEHTDELLREFALIREIREDHVPARLLALMDELNTRFAAFTQGPTDALQQALSRGDDQIDLLYKCPPRRRTQCAGWRRCSTRRTTSVAPATC